MSDMDSTAAENPRRNPLLRWLPIAIIAAVFLGLIFSGIDGATILAFLQENRQAILDYAGRHQILAPLIFVLIYAAAVAVSVPGAVFLTLTCGFVFGTWLGGSLAVVGASIGAAIIFLAAKTALGDSLRDKAGPRMKRFEEGFHANAFNYLLVLRMIPIFPFWLINLAAAFLGVRFRTYVVATFLGIIPVTFVYASLGNGLGAAIDLGTEIGLSLFLEPQILLPLVGLVVLALLPVIYKRFRGNPAGEGAEVQ